MDEKDRDCRQHFQECRVYLNQSGSEWTGGGISNKPVKAKRLLRIGKLGLPAMMNCSWGGGWNGCQSCMVNYRSVASFYNFFEDDVAKNVSIKWLLYRRYSSRASIKENRQWFESGDGTVTWSILSKPVLMSFSGYLQPDTGFWGSRQRASMTNIWNSAVKERGYISLSSPQQMYHEDSAPMLQQADDIFTCSNLIGKSVASLPCLWDEGTGNKSMSAAGGTDIKSSFCR